MTVTDNDLPYFTYVPADGPMPAMKNLCGRGGSRRRLLFL